MSYGCAVFTIVIRVVAKDLGGEASAPVLYLLGRWRRWRSLLLFHEVRRSSHIRRRRRYKWWRWRRNR
jgi:hypothetical protein